jgi:histidinol-phosphate/aromatic aminotransferase/cobyric acid decarboxylase-like protein
MVDDGLGPQGGDLRNLPPRTYIDLSTCVNRYGPPPAALAAFHAITPDDLRIHPYGVEAELINAYAAKFSVDPNDLIPGRGTTGFIRALARAVPHADVAIPFPAYTDFFRAFPGRGGFFASGDRTTPHIGQVAAAMAAAKIVILANPNNPCGTYFSPEALIEICDKNPEHILVVDESYIDFVAENAAHSLVGARPANLLVLQSPSKFYGIAGVRAGIAWTCGDRIKALLSELRDPWPLSLPDVKVALAALDESAWAQRTREQLLDDGQWLDRLLRNHVEVEEAAAHYRFFFCDVAGAIRSSLLEHGIIVRALGAAHGVPYGGVRIAAPKLDEREKVAAALNTILAKIPSRAPSL